MFADMRLTAPVYHVAGLAMGEGNLFCLRLALLTAQDVAQAVRPPASPGGHMVMQLSAWA